jgi:transposase
MRSKLSESQVFELASYIETRPTIKNSQIFYQIEQRYGVKYSKDASYVCAKLRRMAGITGEPIVRPGGYKIHDTSLKELISTIEESGRLWSRREIVSYIKEKHHVSYAEGSPRLFRRMRRLGWQAAPPSKTHGLPTRGTVQDGEVSRKEPEDDRQGNHVSRTSEVRHQHFA